MDCQRQKRLLASRRATDTSLRDRWQSTQFYELEYCALQACAVRSVWGFVLIAVFCARLIPTLGTVFSGFAKEDKGHGK